MNKPRHPANKLSMYNVCIRNNISLQQSLPGKACDCTRTRQDTPKTIQACKNLHVQINVKRSYRTCQTNYRTYKIKCEIEKFHTSKQPLLSITETSFIVFNLTNIILKRIKDSLCFTWFYFAHLKYST